MQIAFKIYAQTAIAGYTHNGGLIFKAYVDEKR